MSFLSVSVCGGKVPSSAKLILTLGLYEKFEEKFSESIEDCCPVKIWPDKSGKELSMNVESGASVAGEEIAVGEEEAEVREQDI
ncbi:uncharacterized protein MONOS_11396 [Monocercomonoides exilis]|uniref:uncharacterized protein n=1 Tax=Monocercomonoides exilis TaxID=2049356 RepID=UPI003559B3C5|nr:hypothetical protein MONOS_11396 [Monocercomonoides exilis]|eukprot:MONOS_11396.1-p1 / transcript=MONOS_11396.1 / gene=MONOS_11396 / organism=Monocercomonoides_exilis_PA203 / gene_product=unspecified product / transcript_product=unspecified product / location=Mono_scaffold00569:19203-19454(+) / protein_length=84 / sequence_SO=supercontig / SO=protein_coding / is_pseudo=false